jgi:hypothetical protein
MLANESTYVQLSREREFTSVGEVVQMAPYMDESEAGCSLKFL